MDKKTQKIMTMKRTYQPQSEGEGGLRSIVDCVETEGKNISLYLGQWEERLLRFSNSERILPQYEGAVSTAKKQKKEKCTSNGKRKSSMVNLERNKRGQKRENIGMD